MAKICYDCGHNHSSVKCVTCNHWFCDLCIGWIREAGGWVCRECNREQGG